jgi:hypothetical protein
MSFTNHNKTLKLKREQLEHATPAIEEPKSSYSQAREFVEHFSQSRSGKVVCRSPELYERTFSIQMSRQDFFRLKEELDTDEDQRSGNLFFLTL